MKKFLLPILIVVILIQLFIPANMIYQKYDIIKTGQEFKFRVNPIDPYDAFRGRYVSLNYGETFPMDRNGKHGSIVVGKDGFAKIDKISDEPIGDIYVRSTRNDYFKMPIDRYYMDEKMAPQAETLIREQVTGKDTYITVRIKNGTLVITGLYIDGMPIEDIIKSKL